MKPLPIPSLLLVSALFTPLVRAQDGPTKVREIEQKVLLEQRRDAVQALVGTAREAGDGKTINPDLLGKRLQWLAMVDTQIEPGGRAAVADDKEMTKSAETLNDLAWQMVTSPDASKRHPDIALKLATLAIELSGENGDLKPAALDTEARALFLLGKHEEAVAEQEKAIAATTVADQKAGMEATLAAYRRNELPELHAEVPAAKTPFAYTTEKLSRIIIPRIDFEDITVEEAIAFLRLRAKELDTAEPDPAKKGVNFVIRRPHAAAAGATDAGKAPATPGAEAGLPDAATDPGALRVKELRLRNVPLGVALKYICDQTKLVFKVDGFAITLLPRSDAYKEIFPCVFKVPSDFGSPLVSIQDLLKLSGVSFGEGASATRSSPGELMVFNTPSELDKIERLIPQGPMGELIKLQKDQPEKNAASEGVTYLNEKLGRIIIPAIDFKDTSVEEAVDFLRLRAKELDTAEADPAKKGLNFVIRRPRAAAAGAADAGKAATTPDAKAGPADAATDPGTLRVKGLQLKNVPLAVALKYICDQTKLRFRVDDFAVTLVPKAEIDQAIFTRSFPVPPNFGNPLVPIQKLLEFSGINFAEGTSVVLGSNGVLLVTNTPAELDKVEQLIQALRPAPESKPEAGKNGPPAGAPEPETVAGMHGSDSRGAAYLIEKLKSITIPQINFENASVEEAIDFLRKQAAELDTKESDPARKGLNFVVQLPGGGADGPRIDSLRLHNAPLEVALKEICEIAHLRYKVDDSAVTLFAQSDAGRSVPVSKLIGQPASEGISRIVAKLEGMVVPSIDFEDTSLEDAVTFLRKKAVELDTNESDPSRKGLNLIIRPTAAKTAPASGATAGESATTTAGPDGPRIASLHLRNVPLAVALKYICEITGYRYKVDDYAVSLVAQSDVDKELFTRTFRVPRDFPSLLDSGSAANHPPLIDLLRSKGINFAEGSSVTQTTYTGMLMVTNTPSELDKLEQLIAAVVPAEGAGKPAQDPATPGAR